MPVRISFLLTGLWWFGFAQITLRAMPISSKAERQARKNVLVNGFHELKLVWRQLSQMPSLKRFLFSFFLYSMGVQTVMLVAAGFAKKEIFTAEEDEPKLLLTIILIQLVAIIGAIGMSRLAKRIGSWWVITLTVILWIFICIGGFYVQTQVQFYLLATLVGLVMGGIQSMSRSTYSRLLPQTNDTTSFFSFYDVTEKIAIVIGIFTFAYIEEQTSDIRNSIIALGSFFVVALLALLYARNPFNRRMREIEGAK